MLKQQSYWNFKTCWNTKATLYLTSAGVITAPSTGQNGLDGEELSLKYKVDLLMGYLLMCIKISVALSRKISLLFFLFNHKMPENVFLFN